jgi:hypothetical protein
MKTGPDKDASQPCPVCGAAQRANARYPRHLCPDCAALATDEAGRRLQFSNVSLSGGFRAVYTDTGEARESHVCFVRGVRCRADEAYFGGIVIRPQEETDGE